jgi:hypothetical protein
VERSDKNRSYPRVPEDIRKRASTYGLSKDEFADNGSWPWMIYSREADRQPGAIQVTGEAEEAVGIVGKCRGGGGVCE